MKRFILPLAAAFCGSFAASALDATDARLWMEDNAKYQVRPLYPANGEGGAITGEGVSGGQTFDRTWQCVSIPVHVEGLVKGKDEAPHFIPALRVHVYVLFALDGKDEYVLLDKEVNYTDIPLTAKSSGGGKGSSTINVGVAVSPSNAYKIAPNDKGDLTKRVVAVAVEAYFKDAACTRAAEGSVTQSVIRDKKLANKLKAKWWRSKSSFKSDCGALLCTVAETPAAHRYAALGMPPQAPLYAAGPAAASSSSTTSSYDSDSTTSSDSTTGGPVTDTTTDSTDTSATEEEDSSAKGKRGSRNKGGKKRRK